MNANKFLDNKFNGAGYEAKVYNWTNNEIATYSLPKLLDEYAAQSILTALSELPCQVDIEPVKDDIEPVKEENELEFKDLTDELYRVYDWLDGKTLIINNPVKLNVSSSGGHRVLDDDNISHYIPSGWKHLYWKVKEGKKPFAF